MFVPNWLLTAPETEWAGLWETPHSLLYGLTLAMARRPRGWRWAFPSEPMGVKSSWEESNPRVGTRGMRCGEVGLFSLGLMWPDFQGAELPGGFVGGQGWWSSTQRPRSLLRAAW